MNVTTNEALARRRRNQAFLCSMAGIAVLAVGFMVNLRATRGGAVDPQRIWIAYAALVVGSMLSWTGVVLSDRWAARPRADEALALGLKGAGPAYHLYNWCLPADHVLVAPWGIVVFTVFNSEGPVVIRGSRWRDGRPLVRRLLSLGRRAVRDPSRLLAMETGELGRALAARDPELGQVTLEGVAAFAYPGAVVRAESPSVPVVPVGDMRDWLRQQAKRPALSTADRRRLQRAVESIAEERLAPSAAGRKKGP